MAKKAAKKKARKIGKITNLQYSKADKSEVSCLIDGKPWFVNVTCDKCEVSKAINAGKGIIAEFVEPKIPMMTKEDAEKHAWSYLARVIGEKINPVVWYTYSDSQMKQWVKWHKDMLGISDNIDISQIADGDLPALIKLFPKHP